MDVDPQVLPGCSLEGIRVVELLGCDEAELTAVFEQGTRLSPTAHREAETAKAHRG